MHTFHATARRALPLALGAALAAPGAPAATALPAADAPLPREGIYRSLKVDEVPAAYVVLIDTSSSMQDRGPDGAPLYATVKRRLDAFLRTLTPADEVAVVTFGRATSVIHPMSPVKAKGGGSLFAKGLPATATESASDHGSALEAAAEQLNRSTAPVGAVLLLTDGAVNAPGSPYERQDAPAWKRLKERYSAMGTNRKIVGYGVPLAEGTRVGEVLGGAFGAPRILPVDPAALGTQLGVAKDQVRAEKAVSVLRTDEGRGVAVSVEGEGVRRPGPGAVTLATGDRTGARSRTVRVTLSSEARHVPLRVVLRAAAERGGPDVDVSGAGRAVDLAPGQSRTVELKLAWVQDPEFALIPGARDFRAGLDLRADVSSPWTPAVRSSLGYAKFATGGPAVTDVDLVGTVPGRAPGWFYPLVLLVALLGGAAGWRAYKRSRPVLSGTLTVTDLRTGDRRTLALRGREVSAETDAGDVRARITVRGRQEGGRLVLVLRCDREAPRPGGERLSGSGTCELGKSTVLCGIGFSHETGSQAVVMQ
ncbi:vWA domain-containing protein [Streptomyces sp. WMMC940]|uniref:vWA domain-containing protein n=1 Tax=Streptomyces sp. WMMC940 TaxID=3015153 RepID=UPI0022B67CC5|nr:vWA domain-containing protein [Streptomyces sp. WMMC940]MCZ7457874.1 VWA domain-containing protein [Streptomyces sp. WMMC940]